MRECELLLRFLGDTENTEIIKLSPCYFVFSGSGGEQVDFGKFGEFAFF
jgi:hypothetical protein